MVQKIGVAFGGPSPEHEISILTGLQCERVLSSAGWDVVPVYWDTRGRWFRAPQGSEARDWLTGPPAGSSAIEPRLSERPGFYARQGLRTTRLDLDAILTCFHGGSGEGGGAQALFQLLGYPATGGTVAAAAVGMDKFAFGALMVATGIPTLPRYLLTPELDELGDGPLILKPRFGGSSIGIENVRDLAAARALASSGAAEYADGVVLEPFRADLFDLNVSFTTAPEFALSEIEKPLRGNTGSFYTFEEKYISGHGLESAPREIPAQIPKHLEDQIRALAKRVAEAVGYRGIARIDFLSDGINELYVNEINTIPGAFGFYLWRGTDPKDLLTATLREAESSYKAAQSTQVILNGAALRAAGGISGKLEGLIGR